MSPDSSRICSVKPTVLTRGPEVRLADAYDDSDRIMNGRLPVSVRRKPEAVVDDGLEIDLDASIVDDLFAGFARERNREERVERIVDRYFSEISFEPSEFGVDGVES